MQYILLLGELCSSCGLPIDREVYGHLELGGGQCEACFEGEQAERWVEEHERQIIEEKSE